MSHGFINSHCKYACETHRGSRCDLTNRPCNHKFQCEIGDEEDREVEEANETESEAVK